jgi:hypothetical protein
MSQKLVPHLTNNFFIADRISSACDPNFINIVASDEPYVDPFYGNNWSWTAAAGAALYGKTDRLPNMSIDKLDRDGFLRTPFRRVPLLNMNSYNEVITFVKNCYAVKQDQRAMWRGQNSLYSLNREKIDKLRLYGEADIVEPSLLPSSTRKGTTFEAEFETWSTVMELYLLHHRVNEPDIDPKKRATVLEFINSMDFKTWSMATAQHYGLPSSGLDLTDRIDVALFFALHKISPSGKAGGGMTIERLKNDVEPVIFGLSVFDYDLVEDAVLAPDFMQCERPKAQNSFYFGTAWGNATNKAADRMFSALKLKNHENWELSVNKEELFPNSNRDQFAHFLLNVLPNVKGSHFDEIMRQIYFIEG